MKRFRPVTERPSEFGDSPDDRRMREYWSQIRDEIVRQRIGILRLPEGIREMIFGETGVALRPREYEQLLRIADKLMAMSEQECAPVRP